MSASRDQMIEQHKNIADMFPESKFSPAKREETEVIKNKLIKAAASSACDIKGLIKQLQEATSPGQAEQK